MPTTDSELDIVLSGTPGHVEQWLELNGLVLKGGATAFAQFPSFQAANVLVASVDPLIHRLSILATDVVHIDQGDLVGALLHVQLASVVGSPWFGASGSYTTDVGLGLIARFRVWVDEVVQSNTGAGVDVALMHAERSNAWRPVATDAVSYVAAASLDQYTSEKAQDSSLYKLERIQSLLGLRPGELSQLLDVSREGLRKWQAGSGMAPERSSRIDDLYNLATWLAVHIRPEALPAFMRRHIQALGGQTPVEWLRARRWDELRRVYERAFSLEVSS